MRRSTNGMPPIKHWGNIVYIYYIFQDLQSTGRSLENVLRPGSTQPVGDGTIRGVSLAPETPLFGWPRIDSQGIRHAYQRSFQPWGVVTYTRIHKWLVVSGCPFQPRADQNRRGEAWERKHGNGSAPMLQLWGIGLFALVWHIDLGTGRLAVPRCYAYGAIAGELTADTT